MKSKFEKLDYPKVVYYSVSTIFQSIGSLQGPMIANHTMNLEAQLMGLEAILSPYLGKPYSERVREIKKQRSDCGWNARDIQNRLNLCIDQLKLLMAEAYSAGLLPDTKTEKEEEEEANDQTNSQSN